MAALCRFNTLDRVPVSVKHEAWLLDKQPESGAPHEKTRYSVRSATRAGFLVDTVRGSLSYSADTNLCRRSTRF